MRIGRSLPRGWGIAGAALLLTAGAASGYRLYSASETLLVPTAEEALRWDATEWGAARTLTWTVALDSGWTDEWEDSEGETQPGPFARVADFRPVLTQALAAWGSLESADLRWRAGGTASARPGDADGRNTIGVVATDAGVLGWAAVWVGRDPGEDWKIIECDIGLAPVTAAALAEGSAEGAGTLLHELGHCIGLDHAPEAAVWAGFFDRDSGLFGESPKMSYGWVLTEALLPDDIAGASLLRPAADWPESVGSVSGRVTVGGAPARFVAVRSARLGAGDEAGAAPGPGAFTDARGRFTIEGLAPGEYLLGAGSFTSGSAHPDLVEEDPSSDAAEGLSLEPVTVRAGERTAGAVLALTPGREGSDLVR